MPHIDAKSHSQRRLSIYKAVIHFIRCAEIERVGEYYQGNLMSCFLFYHMLLTTSIASSKAMGLLAYWHPYLQASYRPQLHGNQSPSRMESKLCLGS